MRREVTLGNLFSGSGAWELAAKICGIRPVFEAEIEPFPVALEEKRFPECIQLGDVSKINGADIPPVDILTNSSPCFAAGMMVRTKDGMRTIEEIKVGDYVLTHTGEFHKVLNSGCTGTKETVKLKAMGICDIIATPNHPFYVRHMKRRFPTFYIDGKRKRGNERVFDKPEWKTLGELTKDDYIGIPINNYKRKSGLTEEELWLVGRYIADGYRRHDQPTVCFCIGESKLQDFKSRLNHYSGYESRGRTAVKYCVTNERLYNLCGLCGDGAINKKFPGDFACWDVDELKIVIDGYMSGDGYMRRDGYRATTISQKLAYDIIYASVKVNRLPCSLHHCKRPHTHEIEGRIVNQHDTYEVFCNMVRHKQDKAFCEDGYVWLPIRKITQNGFCDVYNMTVDVDNSYTVNNVAVHNCQGLSVAGKRAGLDDERSKLFTEAIRITKEMRDADKLRMRGTDEHIRPYIWCWENVPGALSSNSGRDFQFVLREICRIVDPTADVPLPEKGKWPYWGIVDGDTWQVAWSCADASLMGVPQRRKRVFLVADFRGRGAAEILFKPGRITWDFAEIRNAWENTSLSFEDRIDRASRIVSGRIREDGTGLDEKCGSEEGGPGNGTGRGCVCVSGEAERDR